MTNLDTEQKRAALIKCFEERAGNDPQKDLSHDFSAECIRGVKLLTTEEVDTAYSQMLPYIMKP